MKKDEFFKLLEHRLSIIEDSERTDILEEYRQHIAMKMQDGAVSEEDALADFGDVDALADEILSAYHVRCDASVPEKKANPLPGLLHRCRQGLSSLWAKVKGGFCSFGRTISNGWTRVTGKLGSLFHRAPKEAAPPAEKPKGHPTLRRLGDGICRVLGTLLRWCRNLIWGGCSLLMWCLSSLCLIGFGVLLVLAVQGYPLWGASMLCLGLLLCTFVPALLFGGLIRRKNTDPKEGDASHA